MIISLMIIHTKEGRKDIGINHLEFNHDSPHNQLKVLTLPKMLTYFIKASKIKSK